MKQAWMVGLVLACAAIGRGNESSDKEFDNKGRVGIDFIYNLEFQKADSTFHDLVTLYPRHPAGHFFLAMVDWWRIMIDIDNAAYDERLTDSLNGVIDLCDELLDENENNVTALFFKGGALGFLGRLRFHRDDWLGAANAGRQALPIVRSASEVDPNNFDVLLGTGIYNYYAEVIPEQYPIAKPLLLFIPPGDKKKGIEQLKTASERGKYASVEAKYFLMQLYFLYEKEYGKSLALATELHHRYPNNMLFHKYVGRCYISQGNYTMAGGVFSTIQARVKERRIGYNNVTEREAEYYLGVCAMNARNYDEALEHFYRCDVISRELDDDGPSGFMVQANLNVGKIYDAQAQRDLAVKQYRKVLDMKEYRDSHVQAEKFLKTPFTH
jgi:tetratricopeptide (TPR) repeat protein